MKLVEVLSKQQDPWYGVNVTAIYQEEDSKQYWKISYNDMVPFDSQWARKVKVYRLTKTVDEWVEYF